MFTFWVEKSKRHVILRRSGAGKTFIQSLKQDWLVGFLWNLYGKIVILQWIYRVKIVIFHSYLVGGWALPLWKIWKSIGMMTFSPYGEIKHVPNHQPEKLGQKKGRDLLIIYPDYCFTRFTRYLGLMDCSSHQHWFRIVPLQRFIIDPLVI